MKWDQAAFAEFNAGVRMARAAYEWDQLPHWKRRKARRDYMREYRRKRRAEGLDR